MDKRQISVKLIMDGLGLDFSMAQFQDRLIFQKALYLAQEAGLKLGYNFSWYLRGPYSSYLASDGFAIESELISECDESKGWTIDDVSCEKLQQLKPLFKVNDRKKLSSKLELLASVHYLLKRKKITYPQAITDTLHNYGKPFPEDQVREALKELSQYGLAS